jgi:hypothetical protein
MVVLIKKPVHKRTGFFMPDFPVKDENVYK